MSNALRSNIEAQETTISMLSSPGGDFISLTDMVRNFDGAGALIKQWLKNKDTVLFLGVWERLNNPRRSTPPATLPQPPPPPHRRQPRPLRRHQGRGPGLWKKN